MKREVDCFEYLPKKQKMPKDESIIILFRGIFDC